MQLPGHDSSLKCQVGLHEYGPDYEAGYPYQKCGRCGKLGIFRPRRTFAPKLSPLRR